ncbi:HEPN domain-containing protein [Actinoplanes sp. CA-142083]|uniref:HEPN domain-containing protein n=1 Tax=Actinoplanes sp. CA-142083 TaxID=3239903 RepID=UPI003D8F8344
MFSSAVQRGELIDRLATIRLLLNDAHPGGNTTATSREIRGLSIVLLYAAYENLLKSLCRSLLSEAMNMRVGNRRLQPGFKVIAAFGKLQAVAGASPTAIWKSGFDVVGTVHDSRSCSISTNVFPNDGTNFKRTQVSTFCRVFGFGDPAPILREVWEQIDGVVVQRNAVAHGSSTAGEIGRRTSYQDLADLIDLWELRWGEFLDWVDSVASSRDFFRLPR